jgi:septum formation protein
MAIAARKADAAGAPGALVLAADTLVEHGGRILGKPQDELDAHAILRLLSSDTHRVVTGVALRTPAGETRTAYAETRVTFRELTDEEIHAYIATGEPMDKAGAYGIQGKAKAFVASIDGPMDNVVGLPLETVRRMLAESGRG